MKKLKLICVLVLSVIVVSCETSSKCSGEEHCQQQNTKILKVITELNEFGQSIHCKENTPEVMKQVEKIVEQIQNNEDLATLASISRAFQIYGSNEAPTCKNSRADNVFNHSFWICIKKLSRSSDSKNKEFLNKLKENSLLDQAEKKNFDEILANPV
jgi:hypothetical protein